MTTPRSTTSAAGLDPAANYAASRKLVGYLPRIEANNDTYTKLGFKCGLEIHQQLLTDKKLFCHCPAGLYQKPDDFDAELVRHMRPTLSELGEYDGTALMEFRTRKNIIYRIKDETACTYDIDDTPPFKINRQALDIAIEIALMLKTNVVGELHVARKQYLDGSIPTGFQRTAIVGIEGAIPISNKTIRIIQISIEEDSCREISDIGHYRTYTTDRLGMPLIESVTYPDMLTPDEAAEAGQYLRYLVRSSGKVRTGIGAGRQDVNVSVTGGTRVEIKGVAHIRWIPELTHNEAFRQWALLQIRDRLRAKISDTANWRISHVRLAWEDLAPDSPALLTPEIQAARNAGQQLIAVNLPGFAGELSYFTQPGQCFANELSDRLKVIACLERPNMLTSESLVPGLTADDWVGIRAKLNASAADGQLVFWAPEDDIATALIVLEERGQLAFVGVPNETRKSLPDGTTIFERVLPGPDRMYPDTDSAPLPIADHEIDQIRSGLAPDASEHMAQLARWKIPTHLFEYLLARNRVPLMQVLVDTHGLKPILAARLLAQVLKSLEGRFPGWPYLPEDNLTALVARVRAEGLEPEIIETLLPVWYYRPHLSLEQLLEKISFKKVTREEILARIPQLRHEFVRFSNRTAPDAEFHWLMGQLRPLVLGNLPLFDVADFVRKEVYK